MIRSFTCAEEREPNMKQQLGDEIHPGEMLLEEFMKPMGITARQLSSDMDVPPSRISDIVTRESREKIAQRIRVFEPTCSTGGLLGPSANRL
jgi:addiction module HigA family antidote